jgi:hypothetical protein
LWRENGPAFFEIRLNTSKPTPVKHLYGICSLSRLAISASWGYILEMRGSFTRRKHATSSFSEWGDHRMEWKMIPKMLFYLLLGALFLSGCGSNTLDFKIRYQEIFGLRKDDRVLFEERYIGNVNDVKYTSQGDYLVDVSISKEFANDITEHSRFYVTFDPKDMERQAVHMVRIKDDGAPLQKNAIVAGTTKYAVLFDQIGGGLRDNLKRFESELNDLIESFRYLSESEQIKRLEKELDRLLADLQYLSEEMKHRLKTEILPRIKERIEELRRRLKELGREDDLKHVDRKVEELAIEL